MGFVPSCEALEEPQAETLVVPFRKSYAHRYSRLSLDRRGHLFVNYRYYANNLFPDEVEHYRRRWPDDNIQPIDPKQCVTNARCSYKDVKSHFTALIVSFDAGGQWRLATTDDFHMHFD